MCVDLIVGAKVGKAIEPLRSTFVIMNMDGVGKTQWTIFDETRVIGVSYTQFVINRDSSVYGG
jgi:hypothetical protein